MSVNSAHGGGENHVLRYAIEYRAATFCFSIGNRHPNVLR